LLPAIEQRLDFTDQQDALPAISCLGNIGDVAIPALERFLKGNDRALRRSAAEALIRIGSQACLTALRQVAQSGDPDLVPEAQVGILRIQCRAIDRVYRHPRFPPEDELRLWHLAAIAMPGHDQTVRDGKMRARAEEVLVKLGTKAVGVLRLQLANRNHGDTRHGPVYFVTEYAAKILVRIGRPAVPCLIDALCDEQPHARAAAAQALQKITGHAHGADYAAWSTWFLKQTGRS
jgi:HEAT repeat protein